MASIVFNTAKQKLATGALDLSSNMRIKLLDTSTTAETDAADFTKDFIADIGTLGEYDGANYAEKDLTTEAVNEDDPNDRVEFTADNITWTALGAGTNSAHGLLLYKFVTNDADSIPVAFIDITNFQGNGGDVTVTWNAEGILQLT